MRQSIMTNNDGQVCWRYRDELLIVFRKYDYRSTIAGNKIVDHLDVVGELPVGAAPTTASFST